METADLERSGTRWVRGFINYFGTDANARVSAFKNLKEAGYNTVVTLKFNYSTLSIPTTQEGYDRTLEGLEEFLDKIYPYTDVLVSGNEPFIESKKEERNDIVINFYKEITLRIHNYIMKQEREIPLFVGAINSVEDPTFWEDYHEKEFVEYAAETPWIAGVDMHIHHLSLDQLESSLKTVSELLRDDQKILATEFSAVKYWKAHTSDPMPEIMAEKYGFDPSWKVYDYINYAVNNRGKVTREQWEDFLGSCGWYVKMQDYLLEAYARFMDCDKFYLATYGTYIFFSGEFGPNSEAWLFNPLYATATVQRDEEGRYQPNYKMLENFRLIQSMTDDERPYVLSVEELEAVTLPVGTPLEEAVGALPKTAKFYTSRGSLELDTAGWECDGEFDPETPGTYLFTARDTAFPEGTDDQREIKARVTVILQGERTAADVTMPEPGENDYWFKLDGAPGDSSAVDSIQGYEAPSFSAEYVEGGVTGNCASFSGAGAGIQLGTAEAVGKTFFNSGYTARTLAFWFSPVSLEGKQMLAELGGNLTGLAIRINSGVLEAAVGASPDGKEVITAVVGQVDLSEQDLDRWIHVALSFDEGVCRFYVDGALVGEETVPVTTMRDARNPSDIGCNAHGSNAFNDGTAQNFTGLIDDLRIYGSAVAPTLQ